MMRGTNASMPVGLMVWTGLVTLFIIGPLLCVALVSLTPLDYVSFPQHSVSLRWYRAILDKPELLAAAFNSLVLALSATVGALALGLPAAMAMARQAYPGKQLIIGVLMSPLFLPHILSALAILSAYSAWGWSHQPSRILAAHIALTIPYVLRTLIASLSGMDVRQELAARNLGASHWQVFWKITLPQIRPGLLAAAIFAFIVSFDDVGLSIFLTGAGYSTLPVQLFSYASYNSDPSVAAISVAMVVISFIAVLLVERYFGLEKLIR